MLPTDVQRLSACDEHLDIRTGRQHLGDVRSGRNYLFEIIQEQQDVSASKVPLETLQRGAIRVIEHAQCPGDGIHDERRIAHGCEIHEHCAIVKLRSNPGGQLDCKPCLADTWGTRDCDEPDVTVQNEVLSRLQVLLATDQ